MDSALPLHSVPSLETDIDTGITTVTGESEENPTPGSDEEVEEEIEEVIEAEEEEEEEEEEYDDDYEDDYEDASDEVDEQAILPVRNERIASEPAVVYGQEALMEVSPEARRASLMEILVEQITGSEEEDGSGNDSDGIEEDMILPSLKEIAEEAIAPLQGSRRPVLEQEMVLGGENIVFEPVQTSPDGVGSKELGWSDLNRLMSDQMIEVESPNRSGEDSDGIEEDEILPDEREVSEAAILSMEHSKPELRHGMTLDGEEFPFQLPDIGEDQPDGDACRDSGLNDLNQLLSDNLVAMVTPDASESEGEEVVVEQSVCPVEREAGAFEEVIQPSQRLTSQSQVMMFDSKEEEPAVMEYIQVPSKPEGPALEDLLSEALVREDTSEACSDSEEEQIREEMVAALERQVKGVVLTPVTDHPLARQERVDSSSSSEGSFSEDLVQPSNQQRAMLEHMMRLSRESSLSASLDGPLATIEEGDHSSGGESSSAGSFDVITELEVQSCQRKAVASDDGSNAPDIVDEEVTDEVFEEAGRGQKPAEGQAKGKVRGGGEAKESVGTEMESSANVWMRMNSAEFQENSEDFADGSAAGRDEVEEAVTAQGLGTKPSSESFKCEEEICVDHHTLELPRRPSDHAEVQTEESYPAFDLCVMEIVKDDDKLMSEVNVVEALKSTALREAIKKGLANQVRWSVSVKGSESESMESDANSTIEDVVEPKKVSRVRALFSKKKKAEPAVDVGKLERRNQELEAELNAGKERQEQQAKKIQKLEQVVERLHDHSEELERIIAQFNVAQRNKMLNQKEAGVGTERALCREQGVQAELVMEPVPTASIECQCDFNLDEIPQQDLSAPKPHPPFIRSLHGAPPLVDFPITAAPAGIDETDVDPSKLDARASAMLDKILQQSGSVPEGGSGIKGYDLSFDIQEPETAERWRRLAMTPLTTDPAVLILQKNLSSAILENDQLQSQLSKAQRDNEANLIEMRSEIARLSSEADSACKAKEALEVRMQGDTNQMALLQDKISVLTNSLSLGEGQREAALEKLRAAEAESAAEVAKAQKEVEVVKRESEQLMEQLKGMQKSEEQLKQALSTTQADYNHSVQSVNDLQSHLVGAQSDNESLKSEVQVLRNEYLTLKKGMHVLAKSFGINADELTEDKDSLAVNNPEVTPKAPSYNQGVTTTPSGDSSGELTLDDLKKHVFGDQKRIPAAAKEDGTSGSSGSKTIHDSIIRQSNLVLKTLLEAADQQQQQKHSPEPAVHWQDVKRSIADSLIHESQEKVNGKADTGDSSAKMADGNSSTDSMDPATMGKIQEIVSTLQNQLGLTVNISMDPATSKALTLQLSGSDTERHSEETEVPPAEPSFLENGTPEEPPQVAPVVPEGRFWERQHKYDRQKMEEEYENLRKKRLAMLLQAYTGNSKPRALPTPTSSETSVPKLPIAPPSGSISDQDRIQQILAKYDLVPGQAVSMAPAPLTPEVTDFSQEAAKMLRESQSIKDRLQLMREHLNRAESARAQVKTTESRSGRSSLNNSFQSVDTPTAQPTVEKTSFQTRSEPFTRSSPRREIYPHKKGYQTEDDWKRRQMEQRLAAEHQDLQRDLHQLHERLSDLEGSQGQQGLMPSTTSYDCRLGQNPSDLRARSHMDLSSIAYDREESAKPLSALKAYRSALKSRFRSSSPLERDRSPSRIRINDPKDVDPVLDRKLGTGDDSPYSKSRVDPPQRKSHGTDFNKSYFSSDPLDHYSSKVDSFTADSRSKKDRHHSPYRSEKSRLDEGHSRSDLFGSHSSLTDAPRDRYEPRSSERDQRSRYDKRSSYDDHQSYDRRYREEDQDGMLDQSLNSSWRESPSKKSDHQYRDNTFSETRSRPTEELDRSRSSSRSPDRDRVRSSERERSALLAKYSAMAKAYESSRLDSESLKKEANVTQSSDRGRRLSDADFVVTKSGDVVRRPKDTSRSPVRDGSSYDADLSRDYVSVHKDSQKWHEPSRFFSTTLSVADPKHKDYDVDSLRASKRDYLSRERSSPSAPEFRTSPVQPLNQQSQHLRPLNQHLPNRGPPNQQLPNQKPQNQQLPGQEPLNQQLPSQEPLNQQLPNPEPLNHQLTKQNSSNPHLPKAEVIQLPPIQGLPKLQPTLQILQNSQPPRQNPLTQRQMHHVNELIDRYALQWGRLNNKCPLVARSKPTDSSDQQDFLSERNKKYLNDIISKYEHLWQERNTDISKDGSGVDPYDSDSSMFNKSIDVVEIVQNYVDEEV